MRWKFFRFKFDKMFSESKNILLFHSYVCSSKCTPNKLIDESSSFSRGAIKMQTQCSWIIPVRRRKVYEMHRISSIQPKKNKISPGHALIWWWGSCSAQHLNFKVINESSPFSQRANNAHEWFQCADAKGKKISFAFGMLRISFTQSRTTEFLWPRPHIKYLEFLFPRSTLNSRSYFFNAAVAICRLLLQAFKMHPFFDAHHRRTFKFSA